MCYCYGVCFVLLPFDYALCVEGVFRSNVSVEYAILAYLSTLLIYVFEPVMGLNDIIDLEIW